MIARTAAAGRPVAVTPLSHSAGAQRFPALLAGIGALVVALSALHIGLGTVRIAPGDVAAALLERAADPVHRQIVWELRLPRTLIALVAGAMLGLAGALLQTITRNPLASPALTGVSAGGVLAVVAWLSFAPVGLAMGWVLQLMALAGGLVAITLVYAVSWQGGSDPTRLALSGILVGAICSAITLLILVLDTQRLGSVLRWIIGSVNGRVWVHWTILWPWALVALPLGLLSAGAANALGLGDATATGLGQHPERARATLLFVAALLTAGAVAVVGAIGFIGLIGPHLARRLVGDDARRAFPLSAVVAAAILVAADVVAQALTLEFPFGDATRRAGLPVGALTALLGAPFFLYLMLREER